MPYVDASVRSAQIVAAARAVMIRDGVPHTTLRAVAAEAGVALGTLQYVFPSKDQLIRAVFEGVVEEIADVLKRSIRRGTGLADVMRQGTIAVWDELVDSNVPLQNLQLELLSAMLRHPDGAEMSRRPYERYTAVVTEWWTESATNAGEVSSVPVDRLARIALGGVDGLTLQYVMDPDPARARADLDTFIEVIVSFADIRSAASVGVATR